MDVEELSLGCKPTVGAGSAGSCIFRHLSSEAGAQASFSTLGVKHNCAGTVDGGFGEGVGEQLCWKHNCCAWKWDVPSQWGCDSALALIYVIFTKLLILPRRLEWS